MSVINVINGFKAKIFSCEKQFFCLFCIFSISNLWCQLCSKILFNDVKITVLLTKQYRFYHRLGYLLRWLAGNTTRTFLCFEIDLIHILVTTEILEHCFQIIFKIEQMWHCYTWLVHVFQHISLAETFPDWREKYSDFIRLYDFKCDIESYVRLANLLAQNLHSQ